MSDTTEMQALAASELTIVPVPQRDVWAVVNRRGDLLAVGQYDECRRRLDRAAAATAARTTPSALQPRRVHLSPL